VRGPFYLFKNMPSQSYSASIEVKNGSPDSADFDYDSAKSALTSSTVAYRAKSLGTLRCNGGDMPMVAQPWRELPTLGILFFTRTAISL
jgi:hypothetical protein